MSLPSFLQRMLMGRSLIAACTDHCCMRDPGPALPRETWGRGKRIRFHREQGHLGWCQGCVLFLIGHQGLLGGAGSGALIFTIGAIEERFHTTCKDVFDLLDEQFH